MKTLTLLKSYVRYRRMMGVAEINKLRKLEDCKLIREKIALEMEKLHSLWFRNITA